MQRTLARRVVTGGPRGPRPLPRAQGAPPHPGASAGAAEARGTDGDCPQARCEGELAWLVYIIATVLGSHLTPNSNAETQQLVDGAAEVVVRDGMRATSTSPAWMKFLFG